MIEFEGRQIDANGRLVTIPDLNFSGIEVF